MFWITVRLFGTLICGLILWSMRLILDVNKTNNSFNSGWLEKVYELFFLSCSIACLVSYGTTWYSISKYFSNYRRIYRCGVLSSLMMCILSVINLTFSSMLLSTNISYDLVFFLLGFFTYLYLIPISLTFYLIFDIRKSLSLENENVVSTNL